MNRVSKKNLTMLFVGLCVALLAVFAVLFCVSQSKATAFAASIGASEVKIGGVSFQSGGSNYYRNGDTDTFTGDAENYNAKYEPTEGRLTLKNFEGNFTNKYGVENISINDFEIVLIGDNTITVQPDNGVSEVYGIDTAYSLTISGEGSLTINIENDTSGNIHCHGIHCNGHFTMNSGSLKVNIGKNYFNDNGEIQGGRSYAIFAYDSVNIGGDAGLDFNIDLYGTACGILCGYDGTEVSRLNVTTSGNVDIKIVNKGINGYSYGLLNEAHGSEEGTGQINLTGSGTINIKGIDGQIYAGVYIGYKSDVEVRIEHGELNITNATYGIYSMIYQYYDEEQSVSLNLPDIKIIDSTVSLYECVVGIYTRYNGVLINNSTVTIDATGDNSAVGFNTGIDLPRYGCLYGVNVIGNSQVTITYASGENDTGIGGCVNNYYQTEGLFDLSGGAITIKNSENVAPKAIIFATKLGDHTLLTQGAENDLKYSNPDGILKFEYKPGHSITFDANGGSGEMAGAEVLETLTYELPASTFGAPDGKRFRCWKVGEEEKQVGDTITMGDSDVNVVAQWETFWTVSFDANGGSAAMDDQIVSPGTYDLPACAFIAPDEQHGFVGWSYAADGGIIETDSIDVQSNVKLYAQWADIIVIEKIVGTSNIAGGMKVGEINIEFEEDTITWLIEGIYDWDNAFSYNNVDPLDAEAVLTKDNTYILVIKVFPKQPNMFANSIEETIDGVEGKIGSSVTVNGKNGRLYAFEMYIPADLVFEDSEDLDIPDSVTNIEVRVLLGKAVTGGVWPYTFSIVGDVPGLSVNNQTLRYMRNEKTGATTATIKVTDKRGIEAMVEINVGAVCAHETSAVMNFTATGYESGRLTQSDEPFRPYKFSLDNEESWTTVETAEYEIVSGIGAPAIDKGIKYMVLGDIERLTVDSYSFTLAVHRAEDPTGITAKACTTEDNNDGALNNTGSGMEYRLSTGNEWTKCGITTTGPLPAGTYYIRERAYSNCLTSNYISVTIAEYSQQVLQGTVGIRGELAFGETLTADTDGLTNVTGILSYQWKRNGNAIDQATDSTYMLTQADIGTTITVAVTSSKEVGEVVGTAGGTITKAEQKRTPSGLVGVRPLSLTQSNTGKITGVDETMEWSNINENYIAVEGSEITGLNLGKYYVRYKENATHFAGDYVNVIVPQAWATLTFKQGEGSGTMDPVQVEIGQVYVLPPCSYEAPQNKRFRCWSVDGYDRPVGYEYNVTWDININAVFANFVTLHFNAGEGSGEMEDVEQSVNSSYILPPSTFTPPQGKYFYQWNWNENYYQQVGKYASIDAEDITFIAIYEDRFTVTFEAGEGSGEMDPQQGGHLYVLPDCLFQAPENKSFSAWSVTANGATWEAQPGHNVIVVAPITVTALWEHKHKLEAVEAHSATCSLEGNTAYWRCTSCDKLFADKDGEEEIALESTVIEKEPHTEVIDKAVAPTCTETGLTQGSHCSVCGTVLIAQEVIPAHGHDWGEWTVTTPAQVGVKGVETHVCSRDANHIETRDIPALPYEYNTVDDVKVYKYEIAQGQEKDVSGLFEEAKAENGKVELTLGTLTLTFDANAVNAIGGNNVSLTANVVTENLTIEGAQLAIEVTLSGATFAMGKATVSAPFTTAVPEGIVAKVYYVNGNEKTDMNAVFADGKVTFETTHFSDYIVVFEESRGLSGGAIAGIVIGCVVALAGIAVGVFFLLKKKGVLSRKQTVET